ncbi:MAG: transcription initiation factor IIB family protein [Desulfurococcales archaeon]|nr:transcription initiation factor IIB family protein [Desulfurococcales archaeon]
MKPELCGGGDPVVDGDVSQGCAGAEGSPDIAGIQLHSGEMVHPPLGLDVGSHAEEASGLSCDEGDLVINEDGKVVCRSTGEVVREQIITSRPEWRSFEEKGVKGLQRAGGRVTHTTHHQGTHVTYVRRGRPYLHRRRSPGRVAGGLRVSRATKRDRRIIDMLTRLQRAVEILEIPLTAHETASTVIKFYLKDNRPSSEREKNALVAAAIHRAVVVHNLSVPTNRILEVLGVSEKDMWRAKKKLNDSGAMALARIPSRDGLQRQLGRVATFVSRIVSELNLPPVVYTTALEFVRTVMENKKSLVGKKPEIVAAASVYLVARLYGYENVTQKAVAQVVDVKDSNVRKIYRYLIDDMVVLVVFSDPRD